MWMATLIVVLVVAMLLGPILMLKPSPRQRALGDLRAEAQKLGLRIRMVPNPTETDPRTVACYSLPAGDDMQNADVRPPEWMLVRRNYEHGVHFFGVWDWKGSGRASVPVQSWLKQTLNGLPGSVVAVEVSRLGPAIYWTESLRRRPREQVLAELSDCLTQLQKLNWSV